MFLTLAEDSSRRIFYTRAFQKPFQKQEHYTTIRPTNVDALSGTVDAKVSQRNRFQIMKLIEHRSVAFALKLGDWMGEIIGSNMISSEMRRELF
jgi:hypothetical protein